MGSGSKGRAAIHVVRPVYSDLGMQLWKPRKSEDAKSNVKIFAFHSQLGVQPMP